MIRYTLILIHRGPEYERDFREIAQKVVDLDDTIRVYYCSVQAVDDLNPAAWQRPTLVVALQDTFHLRVKRGTILRNFPIPKLTQTERARRAGIRVPYTLPFKFGMMIDPILFGPFVILKPMTLTSTGKGVHLFRRARAEQIHPRDFPVDHPIRNDPEGYIVQRYVDTGDHVTFNRLLTFLGEPIYAANGGHTSLRPALDSPDEVLEHTTISVQGMGLQRRWGVDDDVMEMAKAVGKTFAEIPMLAVDIIKEARTGLPYFLECNPGGNTWHFSSLQEGGIKIRLILGNEKKNGRKLALELGRREMIEQTGAFDIVARALVEKTHALAS